MRPSRCRCRRCSSPPATSADELADVAGAPVRLDARERGEQRGRPRRPPAKRAESHAGRAAEPSTSMPESSPSTQTSGGATSDRSAPSRVRCRGTSRRSRAGSRPRRGARAPSRGSAARSSSSLCAVPRGEPRPQLRPLGSDDLVVPSRRRRPRPASATRTGTTSTVDAPSAVLRAANSSSQRPRAGSVERPSSELPPLCPAAQLDDEPALLRRAGGRSIGARASAAARATEHERGRDDRGEP